jgi:replicative DNA helicase
MEQLQSLSDVLAQADHSLAQGVPAAARVWPTGFEPLDTYLNGGLRSGELTLLGGPQGLGKTTLALQMIRNVVAGGAAAVYFSFEHDAPLVLERVLAVEAGEVAGLEAAPLRRFREAMEASDGRTGTLADRLAATTGGTEAVRAVAAWGDRLMIHRSSGSLTTTEAIRATVEDAALATGQRPLVVVDYLQKVAVPGGAAFEDERVTVVVEGLKDLALAAAVPVLAVVAADKEGITAGRRLRTHHLRGSSALAYEADVVLVMNDKYDVVARHHLVYDVANAERFRDYAVVTVEKNRNGLDRIDLEFRKRLDQARFDPEGRVVGEQLVDERVFVE